MKIIGSQWKWNYQLNSNEKGDYFSISDSNFTKPPLTDNLIKVLPLTIRSKILKIKVTREDVIHSWFLPGAGIKIDAVPGKTTEQNIAFNRQGYIYGNCTEVCGPFHRIIPIKVLLRVKK